MNQPKLLHSLNVEFGRNVTVVEPVNLYECKIGDDCYRTFCRNSTECYYWKGCKIQSHVFICELVTIGNDCITMESCL